MKVGDKVWFPMRGVVYAARVVDVVEDGGGTGNSACIVEPFSRDGTTLDYRSVLCRLLRPRA